MASVSIMRLGGISYVSSLTEELMVIILGKFFLFLHKTYVVGTHLKCFAEVHLMSTHDVWRTGENHPIIITKYSSLTIPLNLDISEK